MIFCYPDYDTNSSLSHTGVRIKSAASYGLNNLANAISVSISGNKRETLLNSNCTGANSNDKREASYSFCAKNRYL